MEAERYARVKTLFNEICDLDEPARSERLSACGADAETIRQVRALLAQDKVVTTGFAAPIVDMLGELGSERLESGARLGAWTLLRKIGEGGMGSVYQARRSDGHFEQTAAIKVLRGLPSAMAMQYLARERQILASLTHANIARLLDGGATPGGQPYLVMEYLDGIAIDRYCRERAMPRGVRHCSISASPVCSIPKCPMADRRRARSGRAPSRRVSPARSRSAMKR